MGLSFKKPTTLLREAKVGVAKALGQTLPAETRRGYTDTVEFLSPLLKVSYKGRGAGVTYPPDAVKTALVAGASRAAAIMRKANDEFAKVTFLRKAEPQLLTDVLRHHFHLDGASLGGGSADQKGRQIDLRDNTANRKFSLKAVVEKDRRWVINQIREKMLSLSFHLNTGIYLIDIDIANRDYKYNETVVPQPFSGEEGYVSAAKTNFDKTEWQYQGGKWVNFLSGFRHGEVHVEFGEVVNYTANSLARLIIHEATHKYFNTDDEAYAHENTYAGLSLAQSLNNADSFAWAAVSLYAGSVKMRSPADFNADWQGS
jgi:hypothetical protein